VDYKKQLERACALAQKAIPLSIFGRLQTFSYMAQFTKLEGSQSERKLWNIMDQDEDEIIPMTPTNHTSLKEFYSNVKSSISGSLSTF